MLVRRNGDDIEIPVQRLQFGDVFKDGKHWCMVLRAEYRGDDTIYVEHVRLSSTVRGLLRPVEVIADGA